MTLILTIPVILDLPFRDVKCLVYVGDAVVVRGEVSEHGAVHAGGVR